MDLQMDLDKSSYVVFGGTYGKDIHSLRRSLNSENWLAAIPQKYISYH